MQTRNAARVSGLVAVVLAVAVAGCDYDDLDGIPAGFADGIDNQAAAGAGLVDDGAGTLSADFESTGGDLGSADTVARSDHAHDANYVLKAGDTMTGDLTLSADPVTNLQAATKQYVDTGLVGKSDGGHDHDGDYVNEGQVSSITEGMIAASAVGTDRIADGAVTPAKLATRPVVVTAGGEQDIDLTNAYQTIRSVTIVCPSAGTVIVNAVGYVRFNNAATEPMRMGIIDTGINAQNTHFILADNSGAAEASYSPVAALRSYSVTAGSHTYKLVANEIYPGDDVSILDTNISALFIPD